ncbi:MAG TPA: hypothetical protein VG269_10980 [Tepidisphaeraceae bacterium]|jgi:hypothetical protein|nr:hypothetical protein [Tepidisphaeraceae bacterium]
MRLDRSTGATCQETTGFLFKHACPRPATVQCDSCQKLVCELHASGANGTANYCTTCAKRLSKANPSANSDYDPYDPYWYSGWHYRGYGYYGPGYWGHSYVTGNAGPVHDSRDFTEADTAAVSAEGDAAFENEIGGS